MVLLLSHQKCQEYSNERFLEKALVFKVLQPQVQRQVTVDSAKQDWNRSVRLLTKESTRALSSAERLKAWTIASCPAF